MRDRPAPTSDEPARAWRGWVPLACLGALLAWRASVPSRLVFDEVTYVPAIKALVTLRDNLNWEHPPLAKLIMGAAWLALTRLSGLVAEPAAFRLASIAFGLWALRAVHAWMRELGASEEDARRAVWLSGLNFLWFVQSRMAMLDVFFVAFGLWGALAVWRGRPWRGWALMGLALACKWSALPLALAALAFHVRLVRGLPRARWTAALAVVAAPATYVAAFLPLGLLAHDPVPLTDLVRYHGRMIAGMQSLASAVHGYASSWWQWPTLLRPMWYAFDAEPGGVRGVWAGGNPLLYWSTLPLLPLLAWKAFSTRDPCARALAILYWVPLLFWAASPRPLQFYYYYLPSSLWLGPIALWAYGRFRDRLPAPLRGHAWIPDAFVVACGACFLFFLPILDAWLLPPGRFLRYMWLRSWI